MGKKKSKKDKGKKAKKNDKKLSKKSSLGSNIRDIGTALVGAAVGEIAQAVVSRTVDNPAATHKLDKIQNAAADKATGVKDAVTDIVEAVGNSVGKAQSSADSSNSSVDNVINKIVERVDELREQANDKVAENLNLVEDTGKNGKHEKKKDKKS